VENQPAVSHADDAVLREPRRLRAIVLELTALAVLAQGLFDNGRRPVEILGLVVAAACLWSALTAMRSGEVAAHARIGVSVLAEIHLATQLAVSFFGTLNDPGRWRLAVTAAWAPAVLIIVWLLGEDASSRRLPVIVYYAVLTMPAAALWALRGATIAFLPVALTGVLLLTGVALTLVLAALSRLQERVVGSWAAQDALKRMAHTDPLTELPNRRGLLAHLTREMAMAARFRLPLAVIEFDLDYFKEINDVYGHQTGDRVLTAVARQVQRRLRATDVVGRMGGEEFLILAPGDGFAEGMKLAEEICRALRERPMAGDRAWVTGSFGVTVWEAGDTAEAILLRVDSALYAAKRRGRNCVEGIVHSMSSAVR
jgi:diguanylate cyclase (GGDEF)-like protein